MQTTRCQLRKNVTARGWLITIWSVSNENWIGRINVNIFTPGYNLHRQVLWTICNYIVVPKNLHNHINNNRELITFLNVVIATSKTSNNHNNDDLNWLLSAYSRVITISVWNHGQVNGISRVIENVFVTYFTYQIRITQKQ